MEKTVEVSFKDGIDTYECLVGKIKPKKNITVIVDTERGLQFGKVITDIREDISLKKNKSLGKVIRIATKTDYQSHLKNEKDAKEALEKCKKLVEKYQLKMQIVDASYTFDRTQLLFRFVAENRVDFRDLARDLAGIYKTRIELRQIGIRDKAKEIGGIGLCGKCICCSQFLDGFNSVSISMAKNQNISLNPSKINGVCGRLLCCLNYENEMYKDCKKCLPKMGQIVKTEKGEGKVIELDILNKKYKVDIKGVGVIEIEKECLDKDGSCK